MTLKQLTWRLTFPLAITLFGMITKWWYVLPVDAPDTMMVGFPLAFASDGWHTSMSLQIFVVEFLLDFIIYFAFCFLLIFFIDRYFIRLKVPRLLTAVLWTFSVLVMVIAAWIASFPDQIIRTTRNWDRQVMATGFKFTWRNQDRPDLTKYDSLKSQ